LLIILPVGGDHHHVELVYFGEFLGLGIGGAGHAGEFVVHAEIVLEGDGGQGLVFVFDLDPFLGFQSLMESVRIPAAGHEPAREFVHDDDLALLDDIVHILGKQGVGFEGLVEVVQGVDMLGVVQVVQAHNLFGTGHAFFGEDGGAGFFVHGVIHLFFQFRDHAVDDVVFVRGLFGGSGNDQRGPRFVDKDGVHLVHDGEIEFPLDVVFEREFHIVPQIVEPEFVVGAVRNIRAVGGPAFFVVQAMQDRAHAEAHKIVYGAHPFGVAAGEVVVDRDHVDAFAGEGVQVHGQGGGQGFALAGFHFRDLAFMEDKAADDLHIKVPLAQRPDAGFSHRRKRPGQNVVQGGALVEGLFEFTGDGLEAVIRH
jgi:hypothetical protein